MAALAAVSAAGEELDVNAAADTPWIKACPPKECYVGRGRHTYCGGLVAEVALVERKGETGQHLIIGLPRRINAKRGVKITLGGKEPVSQPVSGCGKFICTVDYKAGDELVERFKQGGLLMLEAVGQDDVGYTVTFGLAGFAEAYDGPPVPLPEIREISQAEMAALRQQSERAAAERRARCGPQP